MALFGSNKNQRATGQYMRHERGSSGTRQQQERALQEMRARARNRLAGAVILVLIAIIVIPMLLKTSDEGTSDSATQAPLAPLVTTDREAPTGTMLAIASGGETDATSSVTGIETTQDTEVTGAPIASGVIQSDEDSIITAPVEPKPGDPASGLSVAEATAIQRADTATGVSDSATATTAASSASTDSASTADRQQQATRTESQSASTGESTARRSSTTSQSSVGTTTSPAAQPKQTPAPSSTASGQRRIAEEQRTDDGSRALAILEGRSTTAAPNKAAAAPATSSTQASSGNFSLQVASYSSAGDARRQRDRLHQAGVSNAYIQMATVNNQQVYRLRVGPFSSRDAAQAAQTRLRALNFTDSFITGQ